ncbi:MAG: hypothetical protein PVH61_02375 [Candidatus Aminicenantes bacterium]|jgi:hypothetical protein
MDRATLDLLDAELNRAFEENLAKDYLDRVKLLTNAIRIDPWWSEKKYDELQKYLPFLNWKTLKYSPHNDIDAKINSDSIGVYFFYVMPEHTILDKPQYVFYVGISSKRPLKDRLKDYYNINNIKKRSNIHNFLAWHYPYVYIAFSLFDSEKGDIEMLEKILIEYFQPFINMKDFQPETMEAKKAWVM